MKDIDIIKAIAELDGYAETAFDKDIPAYCTGIRKGSWSRKDLKSQWENTKPYLTSHDAIISVIEKLAKDGKPYLIHALWWMIDELLEIQDILPALKATPPQLCEALLRATGRWKD